MLAGALVLRGDDGSDDLNVRAVLLDTAADAAAAAGTAVSGAVIVAARGWYWLDPAVALVIGYHAGRVVLEVTVTLRSAGAAPRQVLPRL